MPANACVNPLGVISGQHSKQGTWDSSCLSQRNGSKYARFYTFTLDNRSDVTIDLTSSTDTYLYLMSGHGKNGVALYENDDIDTAAQNYNSRISEKLAPGDYTIEATTYGSRKIGSFNLSIDVTAISTALNIKVGLKVVSNRGKNPSTRFADFRWQLLDSVVVELTDFTSGFSARDYEYRIRVPYTTGIQVSQRACNWSASASSWPGESSWTDAGNAIRGVRLQRCGLGNGVTSLTVQIREKSDKSNIDYNSYSTVVKHPWHIRDNNLTYSYTGPTVPSDSMSQSQIDGFKAAADRGAAKWNSALGSGRSFTFGKTSLASSADVVVQGYSSSGSDPCGGAKAVACVPYTASTYPHVTLQQTLYFENPPVSVIPESKDPNTGAKIPSRSVTYRWENDFTTASKDGGLLYMPIYMAHELGHAAGLWHSPGASDGMTANIASSTQKLNSNDKNAMKALYDNHRKH